MKGSMSAKNGLFGLYFKKVLHYPVWMLSAIHQDPTQALLDQVRFNPRIFLPLCGRPVAGLSQVEVLEMSKRLFPEGATARVRGRAIAADASLCEGEVRFKYSTFDTGHLLDHTGKQLVGIVEILPESRTGDQPISIQPNQKVYGILGDRSPRDEAGMPMDEYVLPLDAGRAYLLSGSVLYGRMTHPTDKIRVRLFFRGEMLHDESFRSTYLSRWSEYRPTESGEHLLRFSFQGQPEYRGAYEFNLAMKKDSG
jgi:hypothetical protein